MSRIDELELSQDHKAIKINGVMMELPRRIEEMKIVLRPECERCPIDKLRECLLVESRELYCETAGSSLQKINFNEVY